MQAMGNLINLPYYLSIRHQHLQCFLKCNRISCLITSLSDQVCYFVVICNGMFFGTIIIYGSSVVASTILESARGYTKATVLE